ncbi:MAG: hypothetical protein NVS4B3_21090 [Gemmatimonadaceae bacterium]
MRGPLSPVEFAELVRKVASIQVKYESRPFADDYVDSRLEEAAVRGWEPFRNGSGGVREA